MDILNAWIALIPVTLAQSLILSFVVLAVMLPFRILSFPDLTSEGAYPLGGPSAVWRNCASRVARRICACPT